ncbi:MAG: NAD(P)H-dependent oxidoreductase, partial [Cellulosilyticaceae bacterium]
MKKLLYITASPSEESKSISKRFGRVLVNKYLETHPDYELEEVELYKTHIPELSPRYLTDEVKLVQGPEYDKLSAEEKKEMAIIDELGNQFLEADTYIIASPMWDLSFPARLKMYIDCICLGGKVIAFGDEKQ